MTRVVIALLLGVSVAAELSVLAADDPPRRELTAQERQRVADQWQRLIAAGSSQRRANKLAEAEALLTRAVNAARLLYARANYPDGHKDLVLSLGNLGVVLDEQGKANEAEPVLREALRMQRLLVNEDHVGTVAYLDVLAGVLWEQRKYAEAEDLLREAVGMQRRLVRGDDLKTAGLLKNLALALQEQKKLADAEPLLRESLGMWRRLVQGDHPELINCLELLAWVVRDHGNYAEAETLLREVLDRQGRLIQGDHGDKAKSLDLLASVLRQQGKYTEAEKSLRDVMDLWERLVEGDVPQKAICLSHLALVLQDQGNDAGAETLHRKALAMHRNLYSKAKFPAGHLQLARSLESMAHVLRKQPEKFAEAETLLREALEMRGRLAPGDQPESAECLTGLGSVLHSEGKHEQAEQVLRAALRMRRRLFKDDCPDLSESLWVLAYELQATGKHAEAETLLKEVLRMDRALLNTYAENRAYGEALTMLASWHSGLDGYLTSARTLKTDPVAVYPEVWAAKAATGRVVEQRQAAARAATDSRATSLVTDLATARRHRADLMLAPTSVDPGTRKKRDEDLKELADTIARLDRELRPLLPALSRAEKLSRATPADLQKALPADVAVVDFLRYKLIEQDPRKPGAAGETLTHRYLAFVVTRDKVTSIDLGPAILIELVVAAWREAITGGEDVPPALPARVRDLGWAKVRKALPDKVNVVYISPDLALCRVPWAALPGDKPNTILLEDYAVAVVPHAAFLLDKLWTQDSVRNPATEALVVGDVAYDAELATPGQWVVNRGNPPLKPGQKAAWPPLTETAAEARGVAGLATKKKLAPRTLDGEKGSAGAVLAALPKAKYAHLATHGFFADPSFRSAFQVDPKLFEMSQGGERVGAGALNPLVMTGLVFAGANKPNTPSSGIMTGEALVDLDLSGLDLAVLSACETGLGDVAGGEGTFGLQRAFHLAGTRDVVASLWKVPDQATAALMAEFYRNLWEKNEPPLEALRQAQLTIYRSTPEKRAELAAVFRGTFKVVPGSGEEAVKPGADGKAHPRLWAAFSLSGPGR